VQKKLPLVMKKLSVRPIKPNTRAAEKVTDFFMAWQNKKGVPALPNRL
jgi:hypothetical protein